MQRERCTESERALERERILIHNLLNDDFVIVDDTTNRHIHVFLNLLLHDLVHVLDDLDLDLDLDLRETHSQTQRHTERGERVDEQRYSIMGVHCMCLCDDVLCVFLCADESLSLPPPLSCR